MLSHFHLGKDSARRWACGVLALALGTMVALLICPRVDAQAAQPAENASPPPAAGGVPAKAPAEATPTPAAAVAPGSAAAAPTPAGAGTPGPASAATAVPAKPAIPAKPPAPRLNRNYMGLIAEPTAEEEKAFQKERSENQKNLKMESLSPAVEQALESYYRKLLARWTITSQQHKVVGYINELKGDLAKCYGSNRSSNPVHDKVIELVFWYMTNYTDSKTTANPKFNFAPTARFNAVLMLGELNEVEPSGSKPAKPLAKALPELYKRASDPQQIDAVRMGALIGIRRHCKLMADAGQAIPEVVLSKLEEIAGKREPERVRSDEGHAWLRLVAVQTLADVKGGPDPAKVATLLLGIISETESPEFLRFAAAKALGSLDYRKAPGLDMNVMLQSLGLLAIEVCDQERQRLRDELESKKVPTPSAFSGGTGEGYMGGAAEASAAEESVDPYGAGAMTPAVTTEEDLKIERVRRRLKEGMSAALVGMGKRRKTLAQKDIPIGISAIAGTDTVKKQNVEAFSNSIHDFFVLIDKKEDDKQIQAKPLDTAIANIRKKLEEALSQVGGTAPKSPVFKPLTDPKSDGGYGGAGVAT